MSQYKVVLKLHTKRGKTLTLLSSPFSNTGDAAYMAGATDGHIEWAFTHKEPIVLTKEYGWEDDNVFRSEDISSSYRLGRIEVEE